MELERRRQLSVYLQNKPGELFRLCDVLREAEINILALTAADTVDHAVDRLIVDEPERAVEFLRQEEFLVTETDVLAVTMPDQPGALANLTNLLERHSINIDYAYCTTHPGQESGFLILCPSDLDEAESLLADELTAVAS